MFKKVVQRGRSKRRGEAYFVRYVEPLSAARTKLEAFFNILLGGVRGHEDQDLQPGVGVVHDAVFFTGRSHGPLSRPEDFLF